MGTEEKLRNIAEKGQGKAKEAAGKALDDPVVTAKGRGKQMKSDLKQAGEKIKDVGKD
ncbi:MULTISPECIES: CsbD family protein [Kitasatospora]|uniref:CsbD family protein n=1 Tax=Kitasatospora cathayae TaxID=3004092 RepID=A0ABY7PVP9_9ACTN|nr:CsbD family protein [Kitasatospora sp. HUAS 3-15]WBP84533.1 CsbD family protein [Kitasatospora sp. HUAS 3-15]